MALPTAVDYSVVYVHIGSQIPSYLHDAIAQARLFNQEVPIYLITNKQALNLIETSFGKQYNIIFVTCESLFQSKEHKQFLSWTSLDSSFWDGFWRRATERFFYLHELMISKNLQHVFHIENDNMLYVDLAQLFPVFKTYAGIAAVFDNDDRCIPSFMYIPHQKVMDDFVAFVAENAKRGLNDMSITAQYRKERSCGDIDNLPVIMRAYAEHHVLQDSMGNRPQNPSLYYHKSDAFKSIFDGAALGQYLGGIDPRIGLSKPGFVNETTVFDPSFFDFEWILDEFGRRIPYMVFANKKYRINNLHIHSKKLHEFRSDVHLS